MATPAPPPRLELNSMGEPSSVDADASFNDLYRSVSGFQAEAQGAEQKFNSISDRIIGVRGQAQSAQTGTLAAAATALKTSDPAKVVTKAMTAISKFAENSAVIMKGLEAVKQIHPFIGLVVVACEAAIQLELTRRENDRKVIALKAEMLDMMEVLLDLRDIKDTQKVDPDGTTLEGRMQRIIGAAEQCIRDCSAACEKYIHKKFIVKLFDGSRWEERLAGFSGEFAERKKEFEFALSIHTAQGVDNVQRTLVTVEAHAKDGSESAQMIILFRQLESPKERELQKWIAEKGGPKAVSENEKLFKELQSKMKDMKAGAGTKSKTETTESLMIQVRDEMRDDIDRTLAKDRQHFDRKFDAVVDKLQEMKNVVHRSTDRVITAINAGPHDRIVDMDLHTIWKEMAWRGSVKARHFIVAVQDYFIQKYSKEDQKNDNALLQAVEASYPASPLLSAVSDGPNTSTLLNKAIEMRQEQHELQDRWAIEYITLTRVRSVLEAFDDDASGWISVREANVFTSSRPPTYSVIKWLAFWSAGFKISSSRYAKKIQNLRARISGGNLTSGILNCNRARIDRYLSCSGLEVLDYLTRGLVEPYEDSDEDETFMAHFDDYIQSEEERLTTGLDRLGWDIDAFNTLQLITGTGRIERHILQLFYLVLNRHMKIITLSWNHPLDDNELWEAEQTMGILAQAVTNRVTALAGNFRNQNLDPTAEFQHAYNGMFATVWHHINGTGNITGYEYPEEYFEEDVLTNVSLLKYGSNYFDTPAHIHVDRIPDDEPCSGTFDGTWTGTESYSGEEARQDGLVVAKFRVAPEIGSDAIVGTGKDSFGIFEISGTLAMDGSTERKISYKTTYCPSADIDPNTYAFEGTLKSDDEGNVVSMEGDWGEWPEDPASFTSLGTFQFTRTPLIAVRHRPSIDDFEENPARARWNMALNVVEEQVRRKLWTWEYFEQRSEARKSYVDAVMHVKSIADQSRFYRAWDDQVAEHQDVIDELQRTLAPEDVQLYNYLAEFRLQTECSHLFIVCETCDKQMTGARYRCLDCVNPNDATDGIDFCEECKDQHFVATDRGMEHYPSHDMIKTLRFFTTRETITVLKRARSALQDAKEAMSRADVYLATRTGDSDDEDEEVMIPSCVLCNERVSKPCWCCTECPSGTFICDDCERGQLAKATDYMYKVSAPGQEPTADAPNEDEAAPADGPTAPTEEATASEDAPKDNENGKDGEGGEDGEDGEDDEDEDEEEEEDEDGEFQPSEGWENSEDEEADEKKEAEEEEEESDEEDPSTNSSGHWWGHILVRLQDIQKQPARVELDMRITMLEQKFAAHETVMRQRLDKLDETVSARLSTLEGLVAQVLAKLG